MRLLRLGSGWVGGVGRGERAGRRGLFFTAGLGCSSLRVLGVELREVCLRTDGGI